MSKEVNVIDKDEEIDLVTVFQKVRKALLRTKVMLFAFLLVGIILGLTYYALIPRTYKSRMIISSSAFQGASFVVILDNLRMLIEEQNYEELAKVLNIDITSAKKIKQIEIFSSKNYAMEEFGERVTVRDEKILEMADRREEFVIVAYVRENEAFKPLEDGIVFYLNNNPAIKEVSTLKQNALRTMKHNIHQQRLQLDSLKSSLSLILSKQSSSKDIFISSPGAMYTDMINLYNTEIRVSEALLASNITVIESFKMYRKQYSPKLLPSLTGFIFVFMILYVITLIFVEGNNKHEIV